MSKANHLQQVEEQLHQRFNEISSEIRSISLEGNEDSLRKLVDERRQILDGLEAYGFDPSSEDGINALANRFVESWTKRILLIGDPDDLPKYLSDLHICHSYIDYLAPLTWNWEKDWLVLVRPAHEMLVATLVDRGQKHILVFDPDAEEKRYDLLVEGSFFIVRTIKEVNAFLNRHQFPIKRLHGVFCNHIKPSAEERSEINHAIQMALTKHQMNMKTATALGQDWVENFIKNSSFLEKLPHISEVKPLGFDTAIIVAPGPSLNKNIKELKKFENKALIISVLHALPKLIKEGIKPDIVIHVDAKPDERLIKFLIENMNYEIPLFIMSSNLPSHFNDIPCEKTVWSELAGPLHGELCEVLDIQFPHLSGGNVSLYAFNLCAAWKLKNIVLVGHDLSYDGDKYYADSDGLETAIEVKKTLKTNRIEVDGYFGGKVKTSADFLLFKEEFKNWLSTDIHTDIRHINCTEGGAQIEGFEQFPLRELIKIVPEKTMELKLNLNFNDENKLFYQNKFSSYFEHYLEQTKIFIEHINICSKILSMKKISKDHFEKKKVSEEELKRISGENKLLESYLVNLITDANTSNSGILNKMTPKEFYSKLRREVFKLRSCIIGYRR